MGFTNDYSKASQGGLKPEGDYEVLIVKAKEKETNDGKPYINFNLVIRNDVKQSYKNGYLFHSMWKRNKPTEADNQVNGYSFSQIMSLGKAAGLPDGKSYDCLADFLQELVGKPVRAQVKHREYKGALQEQISWFNPTDFPEVKHIMKKKPDVNPDGYASQQQTSYANQSNQASADGFVPMPLDDDLPF